MLGIVAEYFEVKTFDRYINRGILQVGQWWAVTHPSLSGCSLQDFTYCPLQLLALPLGNMMPPEMIVKLL